MSGYSGFNRPAPNGAPIAVQRSSAAQLRESEALFTSYEHLQGLTRGDSALTMLRKVASLVKPIMRKRGWRVQILAEFLPPEHNLLGLNVNKGYKICVRLRYHHNPDLFLPVEEVVDTMLHELSHNVWGTHDAKFHALWDELRDEHETLLRKGFTGEGFLSDGHTLGGGRHGVPPPHEMRRLARASAEKRQKHNKLTKGSGQKLGGTPLHLMGGDVRQVIANQITRRNIINKGCASGRGDAVTLSDQAANKIFRTKAEEDDANDRAIGQALFELMEEEEGRKLDGTFSESPTDGGLAWHPELGLYDPNQGKKAPTSRGRQVSLLSEEEQLHWAMQESMNHKPVVSGPSQSSLDDEVQLVSPLSPTIPNQTMAPPRTAQPAMRKPVSPRLTPPSHQIQIPSDISDDGEEDPRSSISSTSIYIPIPISAASASVPIDISEPFNPDQWTCEVCTCINPMQFLACDACASERPQAATVASVPGWTAPRDNVPRREAAPSAVPMERVGWDCERCGTFMEHKWWTCQGCGKMKGKS